MWKLIPQDLFVQTVKRVQKRRPDELNAVMSNLKRFKDRLDAGERPGTFVTSYLHPEPMGILAIDQRIGKKSRNFAELRLYILPVVETEKIYLLVVGDKESQKADIGAAKKLAEQLRS